MGMQGKPCQTMKKPVLAMNMKWKEWKYIVADQLEELYWEVFKLLSLVWSHPVQSAYFVFFAPSLVKVVFFFCPLLISTCLFVLIIFSLGPQLERIKAERDLQWKRFKEAAGFLNLSTKDDEYRRFKVLRGVKMPVRCSTDLWTDWLKGLHVRSHQSILYTEGQLLNDMEEEGLKVQFENQGGGFAIAGNNNLGCGQSIILSKIGMLMDRLVAELGGKVELHVLNALEAITETFIETTRKQYEKDTINSSSSGFGAAENQESGNGLFDKNVHLGECPLINKSVFVDGKIVDGLEQIILPLSKENMPHMTDIDCPLLGKSVYVQGENVDSLEQMIVSLTEEEMPPLADIDSPLLGHSVYVEGKVVDSLDQITVPLSKENVPHSTDTEPCKEQIVQLDQLICDVGTVHENSFQTLIANPESSIAEICPAKLSGFSQVSDKDNEVLDSDEGDQYGSQDEDGLPGLEKCVFKSCRSFPLDASEEESLTMDKLWEADNNFSLFAVEKSPSVRKEKDWKRTLACKLYEEQQNRWKGTLAGKFYEEQKEGSSRFHGQLSSSSGRIPEHQNCTGHLAGKSTSSSSESQILTSSESPLNAEEMDLLWEEYNDAPSQEPESSIKGLAKGLAKLRSLRGNVDSDAEDGPDTPQLCCLKAFRFSTGKMPLRRPNLVKISKAFKNFGIMQHIMGPKQHPS
eukprot:Gb_12174 [translate_table: standard]